jgi:hypothetical protein
MSAAGFTARLVTRKICPIRVQKVKSGLVWQSYARDLRTRFRTNKTIHLHVILRDAHFGSRQRRLDH